MKTRNKAISFLLAFCLILTGLGYERAADATETVNQGGQAGKTVASAAAIVAKAVSGEAVLADYIYKDTFQSGEKLPGVQSVSDFYTAFSLKQAGYPAETFYKAAYDKLAEQMKYIAGGGSYESSYTYWDYDENWNPTQEHTVVYQIDKAYLSQEMGCSNLAKIIMFVNAMGGNPMDMGGINLIDIIMSKEAYAASDDYLSDATILLAVLGTRDVKVTADSAHYTIDEMVQMTVDGIQKQYDSVMYGADSLVMQIQALANVDCEFPQVAEVFEFLEETESDTASFGNVWTQSQVITTMAMFGISPVTDTKYRFIKGDYTVLDDALQYIAPDGTINADLLAYQPEQLLRALTSAIRVVKGEDNIYSSGTKYKYTATEKPTAAPDVVSSPTPDGGKDMATATPKPKPTKAPAVTLKKPSIRSVKKSGRKKVIVKIKKVKNAKGYHLQYSTDKKFKKSVKKVTTKKTTVKIKRLKSKRTYYFRVRAYNGKSKSSWSRKKRIKVK